MGLWGFLFGDNKPLLANAIKEAIENEKMCVEIFVNVLKQKFSKNTEEILKFDIQFELFEIFREIRNKHSKLIEVKDVSSREMYQTLLLLKAKNTDYNGKTDTAIGKIENYEIHLTRTTEYGGVFVNVMAFVDGFNIINNYIKSLNLLNPKKTNQDVKSVNKITSLSMDIINNAIYILDENYKKCISEMKEELKKGKIFPPEKYSDKLRTMTNESINNIKINVSFNEIVKFFKKNCEYERSHPNETVAEGSFISLDIDDYVYIIAERSAQNINEYLIYAECRDMYSLCEKIINQAALEKNN